MEGALSSLEEPKGQTSPPPGTVVLVDGKQASGEAHLVLVPTPANTVNDPLNWSKFLKTWHVVNLCAWTFFINASVAWTSPVYAVWVDELDTTFTLLTYGQSLLVLMCGVAVLFVQPWAAKYGRRLPYLVGSMLVMTGLLFGRFMTDIGLYFAYQFVAGLGSAPAFATIFSSMLDISFLHQKGQALSLVALVMMAGNFLPSIAAGFISDSQGWRWCLNYLLIFLGISSLLVIFTTEESSFARGSYRPRDVIQGVPSPNSLPTTERKHETTAENSKHTTNCKSTTVPAVSASGESHSSNDQRYSYRQRMTLFRRNDDIKATFWSLILSSLKTTALPAVVWTSVCTLYSAFVVGFVLTTASEFFSSPPYNFSTSTVGLMNLPFLIGACLGSLWGGPLSDWISIRLAAKNGGIYEPEQRLWIFLPVPLVGAAGVMLYGIGTSSGVHWAISGLGLLLIGVYLNASTPIVMGYSLDSYPQLEEEIIQFSNFIRNLFGGAMTFGLQPWLDHNGRKTTTILIATILFVTHSFYIFFQMWGAKVRVKTAAKYHKMCEQNRR